MADSSVGGSGLPRPYGKFVGDRAGDGKALVCGYGYCFVDQRVIIGGAITLQY
jgi:hypothetical protein